MIYILNIIVLIGTLSIVVVIKKRIKNGGRYY